MFNHLNWTLMVILLVLSFFLSNNTIQINLDS